METISADVETVLINLDEVDLASVLRSRDTALRQAIARIRAGNTEDPIAGFNNFV